MNNSKTSLFLMELIIVILFFSLSSAVCVQLFFRAHQIDNETDFTTHSISAMQDLSECFYSCDGDLSQICNINPDAKESDDILYVLYDQNWNCTGNYSDAAFVITLSTTIPENAPADGGYMIDGLVAAYTVTGFDPDDLSFMSDEPDNEISLKSYVQFKRGLSDDV